MTRRRPASTPPERRPLFPPWSRAECPECADPVEHVVLDVIAGVDVTRATVERRPHTQGTVAVRMIGDQLHGYTITDLHPIRDGFVRVRLHSDVCEFAVPKAEQHPLF